MGGAVKRSWDLILNLQLIYTADIWSYSETQIKCMLICLDCENPALGVNKIYILTRLIDSLDGIK